MTTTTGSSDPIQQYEIALANHDFLWVVYYRGHWCPFCLSYLKTLQTLLPSIGQAGGKVLVVTAEPAEHLPAMRKAAGYVGEAAIDPEHKLANMLRERGLLDVAVTNKAGYEHGVAQPSILIQKGRGDGTVLFEWAIKPSVMNLGGAKDRPDLSQVWDNVQAKLAGKPAVHDKYSLTTMAVGLKQKIFGW
ncbi:hypothetical protein MMC10_005463 [Thelotrema lepadinum]|nr:hypothetical protein [Thelotrema lepadinum]